MGDIVIKASDGVSFSCEAGEFVIIEGQAVPAKQRYLIYLEEWITAILEK